MNIVVAMRQSLSKQTNYDSIIVFMIKRVLVEQWLILPMVLDGNCKPDRRF